MKSLLILPFVFLVAACSTAEDELAEKGGHSILLGVVEREDDNGKKIPVTVEEVDQTIRTIEGRLEGMGVAEMLLAREGEGDIRIKLPGVDGGEAGHIVAMLEKTYQLGLHEVSPRNDEVDAGGITLAQRVLDGAEIVPGYRAFVHKSKDAEGNDHSVPILLNRRMALGGEDVAMAMPSQVRPDAVDVTLTGRGTDKMIAFTQVMRPGIDRIAIVLDGEVFSSPVVQSVPLGKNFVINGLDEPGEAKALALSLMHPLGNPLKAKEVRAIPPAGK